jgi:hypothetical protein
MRVRFTNSERQKFPSSPNPANLLGSGFYSNFADFFVVIFAFRSFIWYNVPDNIIHKGDSHEKSK